MVLLSEPINDGSIDQLCEFINLTIEKSKLPYVTELQPCSISEQLQAVFNHEELSLGIKSMIVVSSFNQEEQTPLMLFTPSWYTYSFINTGGHFGSYKIEVPPTPRRTSPSTRNSSPESASRPSSSSKRVSWRTGR